MAVFEIDTDELTSAASDISRLSTNISNLADEVKGYDCSNEDGFDFATPQKAIAAAIEDLADSVKQGAKTLNKVAETHNEVQSALKFNPATEYAKEGATNTVASTIKEGANQVTQIAAGAVATATAGGQTSGGSHQAVAHHQVVVHLKKVKMKQKRQLQVHLHLQTNIQD